MVGRQSVQAERKAGFNREKPGFATTVRLRFTVSKSVFNNVHWLSQDSQANGNAIIRT
jgi:hypothetical protein